MQDQFALQPAGQTSVSILIGIAVFIDLSVGAALFFGGNNGLPTLLALLVVLAVSGLFLWIAFAQFRSRIELSDSELILHVPLYGRRIPLEKINALQIQPISNLPASSYQLTRRTNGLGIPGYSLGWFRTRGKGKVLAAVTSSRVLAIPVRDDYTLLLSVVDAEALTRRLRSRSDRRSEVP